MKAQDIMNCMDCSLFEANLALLIMRGRIDPLSHPRRFPNTCKWIGACYNTPRRSEIKLSALDELLRTYGVEPINDENTFVDSYYGSIIASYLNVGETYMPTILLDHVHSRWRLTSWGDFYESRVQNSEE
jgi:hypothetical protein